jgi:hypothetical protein
MGTAASGPREPFRVGLCSECAKSKSIVSAKGSSFYLCTEPSLPKYPSLPVLRCAAFVSKPAP